MTKRPQLNVRIDNYTQELIVEMIKETNLDKSKVVRSAIEYYAHHVLGQDKVMNIRMYKYF